MLGSQRFDLPQSKHFEPQGRQSICRVNTCGVGDLVLNKWNEVEAVEGLLDSINTFVVNLLNI